MEKANELLQLVKGDSSLENIEETNVNTLIDIARKNSLSRKLLLLVKNSDSAKDSVINCINTMIEDPNNDFRIFSMLLLLSDASRTPEAIDLSRSLTTSSNLRTTKLIATNILLRESMYGNKY